MNLPEYIELDWPKLVRHDNIGRVYETPEGTKLPSVTTILSKIPDEDLQKWKLKVGYDEANRIMKEATRIGTRVHNLMEKTLKTGKIPDIDEESLEDTMFVALKDGMLPSVKEVYGIEVPVYMPNLYAGTMDLFALDNRDKFFVGDIKTAKKIKKEEWLIKYKLQLVAYCLAVSETMGIQVNTGKIFMVDRDSNYAEFVLEGNEWEEYCHAWLDILECFYD